MLELVILTQSSCKCSTTIAMPTIIEFRVIVATTLRIPDLILLSVTAAHYGSIASVSDLMINLRPIPITLVLHVQQNEIRPWPAADVINLLLPQRVLAQSSTKLLEHRLEKVQSTNLSRMQSRIHNIDSQANTTEIEVGHQSTNYNPTEVDTSIDRSANPLSAVSEQSCSQTVVTEQPSMQPVVESRSVFRPSQLKSYDVVLVSFSVLASGIHSCAEQQRRPLTARQEISHPAVAFARS